MIRISLLVFIWLVLVSVYQTGAKDAPREFQLRVIDAQTEQPLAAVPLSIQIDGARKAASTDDQGRAVIDLPPNRPGYFSVAVSPQGYVPMRLSWRKGDATEIAETHTLKVERSTSIGGQVLDDEGEPIDGATVMLHIRKRFASPHESVNVVYTPVKTGAEGRWSFEQAPAAFDQISLGAYHHHYASHSPGYGFFSMKDFEPVSALRDGSAVLTLKRGVPIVGTVLGEGDQPLKDAAVGLGRDRVASNAVPDQKTDEQGRFRLAAHPAEATVLTVHAAGYAPDQRLITATEGIGPMQFRLVRGQALTGRVVDTDGQPIAGVRIWGDTWRGARGYHPQAHSDSEGRFELHGLPPDDVLYSIHKEGYGYLRQYAMRPGGKEYVITMRPPLSVSGSVIDAESGRAIKAFTVVPGIEWGNGQPPYWERRSGKEKADGRYDWEFTFPRGGHYIRVEADGYKPAVSRMFKDDEGAVTFDFKLEKGAGVAGRVLTPDGKPAVDARVTLIVPGQGAYIINGRDLQDQGAPIITTKADGGYSFPPQEGKWLMVAVHDSGYAEVDAVMYGQSPQIALKPWGRIEGELRIGSKPGVGQKITVYYNEPHNPDEPRVYAHIEAATDQAGRFVIERVKPGEPYVARYVQTSPNSGSYQQAKKVELEAGQTATVRLGGHGRPVVGRVVLPAGADLLNFAYGHHSFATQVDKNSAPKPPLPADWDALEPEAKQKWYAEWRKSDEGQAYDKKQREFYAQQKRFSFGVAPDGTFRVDDVPAGTYQLSIQVHEPPAGNQCGFGEPVASGSLEFTIPEVPGGQSDEPLDAGTVALTLVKRLKVGDAAPGFEVKTLDEKTVKLEEYRGKYVLLDFWATWCGPCVAETPHLKEVWNAFGKDDRFAMIGLSLDAKMDAPTTYAAKNELGWTQGFLGDWSAATLPKEYGVQGIPSIWLIGPDGKVLAKDLRGTGIEQAVRAALGAR